MRCYTFDRGLVTQGILIEADEKFGPSIVLGERGRGRWQERIALFRKNPAEVTQAHRSQVSCVLTAHPVKIQLPARDGKPEKIFYCLGKPDNPEDTRVLIRVMTGWVYTRDACGTVKIPPGYETLGSILVTCWGAHGDAGRLGRWEDVLAVVHPGGLLYVCPEGGHKTEPYMVVYQDGSEPTAVPERDYALTRALESGEAQPL